MNRIKFFILILVFLLHFSSCFPEDTKPFEVEYKVNLLTDFPFVARISYTDSTGDITFYTTDREWSGKVSLRPTQKAHLLVTLWCDWNDTHMHNPMWYNYNYEKKQNRISGKIIHSQTVVQDYGENVVLISLHKSQAKKRKNILAVN